MVYLVMLAFAVSCFFIGAYAEKKTVADKASFEDGYQAAQHIMWYEPMRHITPFLNPQDSYEEGYNKAIKDCKK